MRSKTIEEASWPPPLFAASPLQPAHAAINATTHTLPMSSPYPRAYYAPRACDKLPQSPSARAGGTTRTASQSIGHVASVVATAVRPRVVAARARVEAVDLAGVDSADGE